MKQDLRISFGIIVLNGEPFTRYNLRSLYPFAHEIIVAEGASPLASHTATPDGHSIDGTLAILRNFKQEEDPDGKVTIVTAEDEGHPNGFWPGEKDEQSQAYAKRATGDWLWQIDIDEFYQPEDMQRVCQYLRDYPETNCLTFNAYHFWGGFDYLVEGGLFRSHRFQGEPWGAYRRVFKWGEGYQYLTHRPPTVLDSTNRDISRVGKHNLTRKLDRRIQMYHYSNIFPTQVAPKGAYYARQGWSVGLTQRKRFEGFMTPLNRWKAIRIFDHYGTFNWIQRFSGAHPAAITRMRTDLQTGVLRLTERPAEDIEQVLSDTLYGQMLFFIRLLEYVRNSFLYGHSLVRPSCKRAISWLAHRRILAGAVPVLPKSWQLRLEQIRGGR